MYPVPRTCRPPLFSLRRWILDPQPPFGHNITTRAGPVNPPRLSVPAVRRRDEIHIYREAYPDVRPSALSRTRTSPSDLPRRTPSPRSLACAQFAAGIPSTERPLNAADADADAAYSLLYLRARPSCFPAASCVTHGYLHPHLALCRQLAIVWQILLLFGTRRQPDRT